MASLSKLQFSKIYPRNLSNLFRTRNIRKSIPMYMFEPMLAQLARNFSFSKTNKKKPKPNGHRLRLSTLKGSISSSHVLSANKETIILLTLSKITAFPPYDTLCCSLSSVCKILHDRSNSFFISSSEDMATTSAVLAPATVTGAVVNCGSKTRQRTPKVVYIGGMNSYGGLKAHNNVFSLGLPASTEQCFAKVVSSLKAHGKGRTGGGALSSKCNDAAEIFKIAAIMNGLVLIGVAVGFVLLRIEATLEESEQ